MPVTGGVAEWRETAPSALDGLLGADDLENLRRVLPQDPCRAILPRLVAGAATWRPVDDSWLAFDAVLGLAPDAAGALGDRFRKVGAYLRRLHAVAVPGDLPATGRQLPRDITMRERIDDVRRWLSAELPIAMPRPSPLPPVLVHGRFSLGVITWNDPPIVLGWREAGCGEPAVDLAQLLGELAEIHSTVRSGDPVVRAAASAFVAGYARDDRIPRLCATRLHGHIVRTVVEHAALRAVTTGVREPALMLVRLVSAGLPAFTAGFADRLEPCGRECGC
ncbi:hypothetical protein ACTOB_008620 [Actinoplanes oblitus]|uniref:Aminoglycoside phosphotransferase domain-containing protein n=1 Tax=Actinoplanes oblitus TaxID=3040509 RepID=A0ABY8WEY2_9ACTN|nr:phosphotransferase [Actinoplanes oblitus]WIM96426.1 hypothetical protein ACTOB_008620 [Actinoplanes oblitus]